MKKQLLSALFCFSSLLAMAQDLSEFAPPALRSSVVAVEFTGQRCRYCPNMSRGLEEREKQFGRDHYIITALHSLEDYSQLPGNHVSLFNKEAMVYSKSIDVHKGLPQLAYNTLGPKVPDTLLEDMYKEDDLLECTGNVVANENNRTYEIQVKTRLRSNRKDFIKGKQIDILLWTLENNIVALQDDNGKWTYPAHKNIFRGSVNGTWGNTYQIGSEYHNVLPIPTGVDVVANTEIIVFFLEHESKTILDAERLSVAVGDAGIEDMEAIPAANPQAPIYDLNGQRVSVPVRGNIYIQNHQKFIAQ